MNYDITIQLHIPNDLANIGGNLEISVSVETCEKEVRTQIPNKLLGIVINESTFFYGLLYCCKIRIRKYHVGGQLGNVGTAAHRDTDVCIFQRRSIINAVSSLRDKS